MPGLQSILPSILMFLLRNFTKCQLRRSQNLASELNMSAKNQQRAVSNFTPKCKNPAQNFVIKLIKWRRAAVKRGYTRYGIATVAALGRLSKKVEGINLSEIGWARLIMRNPDDIALIMPGQSSAGCKKFTNEWLDAVNWSSQTILHHTIQNGYSSGESGT